MGAKPVSLRIKSASVNGVIVMGWIIRQWHAELDETPARVYQGDGQLFPVNVVIQMSM